MLIIDELFFSLKWPLPFLIILGVMVCFSLVAIKKKHLTESGGLAAFITGVVVLYCSHFWGFFVLCFFYVSSNSIGKFVRRKVGSDSIGKKNHTRDWVQVLANGLMAVLASLYWFNTWDIGALVMFGAAVAEASSDTWAGEIGRMSAKPPVSIRTFQVVPKGISGGVTPLGFAGAFAGSFFTALMWFLLVPEKIGFVSVAIVTLAGFSGCILDSFLGATYQAMYLDETDDSITEHDVDSEGNPRKLVRGIRWLDNDMVNLVSNVFSSVFALALSRMI